jgi:phosphate:Na+ symporter
VLARFSRTPLRGLLLGAFVTAAVQSSSATTVMVVGFVSSGAMALESAVGVIMGANLGTTATAWLLSLAGVSGEVPLLAFFKPGTLAPLLAFSGVILLFTARERRKRRLLGTVLFGFGLLFAGMNQMSGAVAPLADSPRFARLFLVFQNPIAGLLLGALLTALMQSSSASVGVLQALCTTGTVALSTVVPIVMGQNIGTCVTALLSGLGHSRDAKRAALLHLYFNTIGAVVLLSAFYLLLRLGAINGTRVADASAVASVHTVFNLVATAILLPFSKWLLRLTDITVKKREKAELQ